MKTRTGTNRTTFYSWQEFIRAGLPSFPQSLCSLIEDYAPQHQSFLRAEQRRNYGLQGRRAFLRNGQNGSRYEPDLSQATAEEKAFLERFVLRTEAQYLAIEQMEQGKGDWKSSRRYRVTGSTFASACDQNPYQTKAELVQEMLVCTFNGNEATERGNRLEPIACGEFVRVGWLAISEDLVSARREKRTVLRWADREFPIPRRFLDMDDATFSQVDQKQIFEVQHTGLVVCRRYPWIACSPDGLLYLFGVKVGVLEIKCPAKDQPYPAIPMYYWNQIAGNAYIQNISFTVLCVYTESRGVFLSYFETDHEYNSEFLLPDLSFFWWKEFLPKALEFQKKIDADALLPKPAVALVHESESSTSLLRQKRTRPVTLLSQKKPNLSKTGQQQPKGKAHAQQAQTGANASPPLQRKSQTPLKFRPKSQHGLKLQPKSQTRPPTAAKPAAKTASTTHRSFPPLKKPKT